MWFLFILAVFLFFLIPRDLDELDEEEEFLDEEEAEFLEEMLFFGMMTTRIK